MKKLSALLIAGLLSACASKPSKPEAQGKSTKARSEVKAEVTAPTYTEKASAKAAEQWTGVCPKDNSFTTADWRKVVGMANGCVKAKDWRKVENLGNHLAVTAHLTPWGSYFLSLAAGQRKDYPRAVWMMELALKKTPNEGLFHYQLGRLHWEMGNESDALKSLKQASDLNPALTDAHWITGQLALQKGDYNEAARLLEKALDVDGKHLPSLLAMATVKTKTSDWSAAEGYLDRAIRLNPRALKPRMARAQIQEMHLKDLARALQTYKEIRQLSQARKLDESTPANLEDKIKLLEQSVSQAAQKVSARTPSAEGKANP